MPKIVFHSNSDVLRKRVSNLSPHQNWDITFSRSHVECIHLFQRIEPELVIIDTCMPDKPGADTAKEILTSNSHTYIIMLSDIDTNNIRTMVLRSGTRDLLVKPFSDSELIFTINLYLEDLLNDKDS